jgi:transposase
MSRDRELGRSEKREFWRLTSERWLSSGLSVRRFCQAEGLSEAAFYWWRRQLTATTASKPDKTDIASKGHASAGSSGPDLARGRFIEVVLPRGGTAPLELLLTSGNVLRICAAVDNASLGRVLSVLREAGLC